MVRLSAAPLIHLSAILLALFLFAFGDSAPALATDFNVNSEADLVDSNPGDGNCAAAGGACTLRAAIMEANAGGNAHGTIGLPAGVYTLTIAGAGEDNSASGDLDITSGLTINGAGAGDTIIDGNQLDRVIHLADTDNLSLNDVTITGGNLDGRGGGIRNSFRGNLTINDSIIRDNVAATYGGGISSADADVVINNSQIIDNVSTHGGGGIESEGGAIVLRGSAVSRNTAAGDGADGGGISMTLAGSVTIDGSTFADNHAGDGGALSAGGQTIVTNTSFRSNTAFRGGAFYLSFSDFATSVFIHVTANNNRAETDGGAMYIDGGNLTVDYSTLSGNVAGSLVPRLGDAPSGVQAAGSGGAVFIEKVHSDTHITNSTLDNNYSSFSGGAVYNEGALTIHNTTIAANIAGPAQPTALAAGNTAARGGGIAVTNGETNLLNVTLARNFAQAGAGVSQDGGSIGIENTILAQNQLGPFGRTTPSVLLASDCGLSPITSNGNNLIGANDCMLIAQDGDFVGTPENPLDPMLDVLAGNGGPTRTMALQPGSHAIDNGDPSTCPTTDQRGFSRSDACDIGAYELGGTEGEIQKFGDVDCDGDVDSVDALKPLQHLAGLDAVQIGPCHDVGGEATINGVVRIFGDVDCDGDVDSVDSLKLLQHLAGITVVQTEPCPNIGDDVVVARLDGT